MNVLWRAEGTNTGSGNGLNATGKKTEGRGISVFRVADGRIKGSMSFLPRILGVLLIVAGVG